jgi:hypothetical protein
VGFCFALQAVLPKVKPMTQVEAQQALEEAHRAGIDLSLIEYNLALSYEERVFQNESVLALIRELRKANGVYEGSSSSPTATG